MNSWMLGLAGGLLIGAGASVLLVMNGRIAGISGILGSLVDDPTDSRNGERLSFVVGLLLVPFLYVLVVGVPDLQVKAAIPLVIAGGLLVGFGARAASGCTSGHGVCGMSRLSPRSLIAMSVAISTGVLVVALSRHLLGWS
ncbi:MAG: YeeE/YedE family protein [Geminicoccaceae bacterium]